MSRMLCLGLGYSAHVTAERLAVAGWDIAGTARTTAGAEAIAARGWRGVVFDGAAPSRALAAALNSATHLLASVPPGSDGDPCLIHHAADIAAAPQLRSIAYFSTVGVYGGTEGGWVDEATPCDPVSERGQRRLAAETAWLNLGHGSGKRVTILRLPGIYGPGRSAFDALRAGTARRIIKPAQVFNRVHVEDIARAVEAVIAPVAGGQPKAPGKDAAHAPAAIYNVTDDEPGPPQDVVAYAASLLGMPPPPDVPFEGADLSPMTRSFYGESKRVSNARLKADLGWTPLFPSYRDGLAAILASERTSSS